MYLPYEGEKAPAWIMQFHVSPNACSHKIYMGGFRGGPERLCYVDPVQFGASERSQSRRTTFDCENITDKLRNAVFTFMSGSPIDVLKNKAG